MHSVGLWRRLVDFSVQSQDVHSRWCANRYTPTALLFVAFCALGAILSWRVLGQGGPGHNTSFFWGDLIAIVVLAQIFAAFRCARERLVLGLLIVRFAVGFAAKVAPTLFGSAGDLLKQTNFALWAGALVVSLSLLYSSLRFRPLLDQTK